MTRKRLAHQEPRPAGQRGRLPDPARLQVATRNSFAQALGTAATRANHSVLFRRADLLLRELSQARADHSFEAVFRRYLAPDLLLVDDFGLHRLTQQQ
ncbi:MAG: ATP-binding protein [Dehalococcoidia bacterium]|nr:ATP-binding protein [Dehalococcoidia bacterium]